MSSFEFVKRSVHDITEKQLLTDGYLTDLVLVSPDAGAYKKVFDYGKDLSLPVVAAVKHRDSAGVIDLKFIGDVDGKDCLIVDDLCDGGYTFLVLADALRKSKARKVYLYISHGIFSKGFIELNKLIDHIYTTNSVYDLDTRVYSNSDNVNVTDYVTQYKLV